MNKYKLLIIACVLVSIFFLSKVYAFINDYTLLGKVIYIDPGHGGIDGGTSYKNIQEKVCKDPADRPSCRTSVYHLFLVKCSDPVFGE